LARVGVIRQTPRSQSPKPRIFAEKVDVSWIKDGLDLNLTQSWIDPCGMAKAVVLGQPKPP
jgi:hypothetical protein